MGGHCHQVGAVSRKVCQPLCRSRIAFVGEVIGRAREPIDGKHGRTYGSRAQDGCNRKIFIVVNAHAAIVHGAAALLQFVFFSAIKRASRWGVSNWTAGFRGSMTVATEGGLTAATVLALLALPAKHGA